MFRSVTHSVTTRLGTTTFQTLDYFGIRHTDDDEDEDASSPWHSRIYRRFSAKFGDRLPYVIFLGVLFILFVMAIVAEANQMDLPAESSHSQHLRGSQSQSNVTEHVSSTNTTLNKGSRSQSSTSFVFSLLLSVLFWVVMIQICRYLQHAVIQRSIRLDGGSATAAARQREALHLLAHVMQAGRAGPGAAMMSNRLRMALLERDFNGEDYEMLQALDDSPHPYRGATQEQIDRLPLHTITQREVTDGATAPGGPPTCNICLAPYEVDEEVRTVPCMHQFHRQCIDTWLRDRAVCPVCKQRVEL